MVATPELDMGGGDARRLVIQADGSGRINLPDTGQPNGGDVLKADFLHVGDDLLIQTAQGRDIVVKDYFAQADAPDLLIGGRAQLDGSLVERLARPDTPLQFVDSNQISNDATQVAQAGEAIGSVEALTGTVTVQRADGSTATLAGGDPIYLGDVVSAGDDGSIGITFVDGTTFSLSSGARMTMDEMVYDPASGGGSFVTSVLQGTFVFTTGSIAPNGNMEVNTPVGTIGIRGTTVAARIALEGSDTVIVLLADPDGHVGRIFFQNAGGLVELTEANTAVFVTSFFIGASEPTEVSAQQLIEFFDQLLQFHSTGPAGEQEGALDEGDVGDLADQLADQMNLGEFGLAAGGDETVELDTTDSIEELSEWLGFVPDPLDAVKFTTVDLSGKIGTSVIGVGGGLPPQGGIPTDYLDPFSPTTGDTPPSPFNFFTGGAGNDTLDASNSDKSSIITGSGGDDTLIGSSFDDLVSGGGGDDIIVGGHGGGNDIYDGGDDEDTIVYASADETIHVNLTDGTASGDPDIGTDKLTNIENVTAGSGDDFIIGNAGNNILNGADGADELTGLAGDDTLTGGSSGKLGGAMGNSWQEDIDVAVFSGNAADYEIVVVGEGGYVEVRDLRDGGDGTDTLYEMEKLRFADQEVWVSDLQSGLNRAPTDISLEGSTIPDGVAGGAVGYFYVTDPDNASEDEYHTFTVSDERFEVVEGELRLKQGVVFDFETAEQTSFEIEVTATDSGGISVTKSFTLELVDQNETPSLAVDDDAATPNAVAEDAVGGAYTGITAKAADQDKDDSITYSLSDDADGRFEIDSETGRVTVKEGAYLDNEGEGQGPYQITVKATDSQGAYSEQNIEIGVTNVNEAPSQPYDLDFSDNQVSEAAANGATVGIDAYSYDSDPDDAVTFSLANDFDGLFTIDAATGIVTIADNSKLDFETTPSYEITIVATDKGGLTSQSVHQIAVTNADEAPTAPQDVDPAANQILEGAGGNSYTGIEVEATDPDADSSISYEVVGENANLFHVEWDSSTQSYRVLTQYGAEFDYETQSSYDITVRATSGNLSSEQTFTINIGNVDEGGDEGQIIRNGNTLVVGKDGFGQLLIDGDEIEDTTSTTIGQETGGDGIIRVTGQYARLEASPQGIVVGDAGKGQLIVEDGGTVFADGAEGGDNNLLIIGKQTGSEGRVDVTGYYSEIAEGWPIFEPSNIILTGNNNTIIVGDDGKGELNIEDGGTVSALNMEIGYGSGTGTVTVAGEGALLNLAPDNGTNTAPDMAGIGGFLRIGRTDGGEGTMNILNGGMVRVTVSESDANAIPGVTIAEELGSKGTLLIDGAQSTLSVIGSESSKSDPENDDAFLQGPWITIGEQGIATATVSNGGQINVSGNEAYLGVGGGNFDNPEDVTDNPQSTLTISSGGYVLVTETMTGLNVTNQAGVYIGDMANGNGRILVTGQNSELEVAGEGTAIVVGNRGTGDLDVEAGGAVTTNRLIVGDTGTGTLDVTGQGSEINVLGEDSYFSIANGAGSTGTVTVSNGAEVNGLDLRIGRAGEGSLTLTGAGTKMTMSSEFGRYSGEFPFESGFVRVGQEAGSVGMLSVLAGAALLITNDDDGTTGAPGMQIGRFDGSNGNVLVEGAGSTISIIEQPNVAPLDWGAYLEIGVGGTGSMTVKDGGTVNVTGDGAYIAVSMDQGSNGSMLITGTNASVNLTGENAWMEIGRWNENGNSAGSITVSNGGSLNVDSGNAEATYNIYVNNGSYLSLENGTVNGSVSIHGGALYAGYNGVATINGNVQLIDSDEGFQSTLFVGVSGPGANHGSFDIDGSFSLYHGTIAFQFAGYNPTADDTFTFLTANNVFLGGLPLGNPADISLAAYGVSQFFAFGINKTATAISFEAYSDSFGGDSIVFRGGNQDDIFGGEASKGFANLNGGKGDDHLLSNYGAVGEGRHIIHGGEGNDLMQGFGDADEFRVSDVNENFSFSSNTADRSQNVDRIVNFDTAADRIVFDQFYAEGEGGWGFDVENWGDFDPSKFIVLDQGVTYDGVLGFEQSEYDSNNPVLILENLGNNKYNLIYDDNGAADGYTIVANVQTTGGNFSVDNVGINPASA
jgi:T5SS/PEP-CTERM-associated repeat protein